MTKISNKDEEKWRTGPYTPKKIWHIWKETINSNVTHAYFDNLEEATEYYDKQCLSKNRLAIILAVLQRNKIPGVISTNVIYHAGYLSPSYSKAKYGKWRDVSDPKWLALQRRR